MREQPCTPDLSCRLCCFTNSSPRSLTWPQTRRLRKPPYLCNSIPMTPPTTVHPCNLYNCKCPSPLMPREDCCHLPSHPLMLRLGVPAKSLNDPRVDSTSLRQLSISRGLTQRRRDISQSFVVTYPRHMFTICGSTQRLRGNS